MFNMVRGFKYGKMAPSTRATGGMEEHMDQAPFTMRMETSTQGCLPGIRRMALVYILTVRVNNILVTGLIMINMEMELKNLKMAQNIREISIEAKSRDMEN